jgi:mono/diheme cytochrome c family protein
MMARVPWRTIIVGVVCSLVPAMVARPAQNAEAPVAGESGRSLFKTYCAVCHGTSAQGDGPLAAQLRIRPPDLTLLARRNGGKFAADKVERMIDGREPVKGHGGPDMPVWGDAFRRSSERYSEDAVKARIKALADHLESLQIQVG